MMGRRKTTEEFIEDAIKVHGDRYSYDLVKYNGRHSKTKIICSIHGMFEQISGNHLNGKGCRECGLTDTHNKQRKTTGQFITEVEMIHEDRYNYSLVDYKNTFSKVRIICPIHGMFEQIPNNHLRGAGCPKCVGKYKKKYAQNDIPVYETHQPQLKLYGVECKRNENDDNILEVKCHYCNKWYMPTRKSTGSKIQAIKGHISGGHNLYCSDGCKYSCSTYGQILYPKDHKPATSREVQPQLRKMVLERDSWTCQKCSRTDILHCHHIDPVASNPIESADVDNCITLCTDCHKEVHQIDGCRYGELKGC